MVIRLFTSRFLTTFASFVLFAFITVSCYLDVDELASIQYGIDISDKPLLFDEDDDIVLSSKYGQRYQCSYRSKLEDVRMSIRRRREADETTEQVNVTQLLEPLAAGPCLIHTAHWWTYEFCYKKELKQYHMEEQKIAGDIIVLGVYASEFDWSNSEVLKNSFEMRQRFHSQRYENGTACDITGNLRHTQVRFVCEEGAANDYIMRVEEPATCAYIVTVHTVRLCASRAFAQPEPKSSVLIVCSPALSASELERYKSLSADSEQQNVFFITNDVGIELPTSVGVADDTKSTTANVDDGTDAIGTRRISNDNEDVHDLMLGGVSVRVRVRRTPPPETVTMPSNAASDPVPSNDGDTGRELKVAAEAVETSLVKPGDGKDSGEDTRVVKDLADAIATGISNEDGNSMDVANDDGDGIIEVVDDSEVEVEDEDAASFIVPDSNAPPPDRVEVKVMNAAYYDSDGKPVGKYPKDSSTSLDQMVLAVIKHNNEEKMEFHKQRRLEENYRFKWTNDDDDNKNGDTTKTKGRH